MYLNNNEGENEPKKKEEKIKYIEVMTVFIDSIINDSVFKIIIRLKIIFYKHSRANQVFDEVSKFSMGNVYFL